ncbi:hypothetical protein SAMN04488063_0469 [Halopelagius inordinatus]|uniref:Uncharacterized protein n=1 Tax=Halopelagius inordinatus TaxID=553467 RepID=A0A1I2LW91_9EURY|nr:hypothetical protein [Halopelagius inordinatus]SFF83632.1 hypothetical protein SAMN04488063_0469 [Halopelagius inordinatus]
MAVTTSEFLQDVPEFDELEPGEKVTVNDVEYTIIDKETRWPSPGESVHYLYLECGETINVVSWNPAHSSEAVWLFPKGSDPMTEGVDVESVTFHGEES